MTNEHIHHWLLESPHGGPKVMGTCASCGEDREFASADDAVKPFVSMHDRFFPKQTAAREAASAKPGGVNAMMERSRS